MSEPPEPDWSDAGAWTGAGLRREAFFFGSGGRQLYGSLYAAAAPTLTAGVVVCGSWGVEADKSDPLAHRLALATARAGGAGLVFHYPGFGDSHGELAEATFDSLTAAAADALAQGAARTAATSWLLAGFTFGATVACLAQARTGADGLMLLQPALSPSEYLGRLTARARRAGEDGMAFGYPVPARMVAAAEAADAAVEDALAGFAGHGLAVRYQKPAAPERPALPDSIEQLTIPGSWRFGAKSQPGMATAAVAWLERRAVAAGAAPS